jgi:deoxyribonuclease V
MLLNDDFEIKEAKDIQIKAIQFLEEHRFNKINNPKNVKIIIGTDISYFRKNKKDFGVSCACVWSIETNKLIKSAFSVGEIKFPYKPGFLGFRESKLIAKSIVKLDLKPDLIMCDGHGLIHPRRFGEAIHLGFALEIPSIGIAKNPFIGFSQWEEMERKKGNKNPILSFKQKNQKKEPELIGYAVCLNDDMKPVFISRGYRTTLDLALEVALKTVHNHRIPEPLFLADQLSREKILNETF